MPRPTLYTLSYEPNRGRFVYVDMWAAPVAIVLAAWSPPLAAPFWYTSGCGIACLVSIRTSIRKPKWWQVARVIETFVCYTVAWLGVKLFEPSRRTATIIAVGVFIGLVLWWDRRARNPHHRASKTEYFGEAGAAAPPDPSPVVSSDDDDAVAAAPSSDLFAIPEEDVVECM